MWVSGYMISIARAAGVCPCVNNRYVKHMHLFTSQPPLTCLLAPFCRGELVTYYPTPTTLNLSRNDADADADAEG